MKKVFTLLYLFFISCSSLYAQTGPVASGGEATGTGGAVSYSIGEVDYINTNNANGMITEGVQQPYEIYVLSNQQTNVPSTVANEIYCVMAPNPFADHVVLTTDGSKGLSYSVSDIAGRMIVQKPISEKETDIKFPSQSSAIYFINVYQNANLVKSFKAVKRK